MRAAMAVPRRCPDNGRARPPACAPARPRHAVRGFLHPSRPSYPPLRRLVPPSAADDGAPHAAPDDVAPRDAPLASHGPVDSVDEEVPAGVDDDVVSTAAAAAPRGRAPKRTSPAAAYLLSLGLSRAQAAAVAAVAPGLLRDKDGALRAQARERWEGGAGGFWGVEGRAGAPACAHS